MSKDRRNKSVWLGPFVLSFDNYRCFSRFEALCYWRLQYLINHFQSNWFTKENARSYYAWTRAAPCISVLWCVVYSSRYGKELFLIFRLIIVKYECVCPPIPSLYFARLAFLASWTNQTLFKFGRYINGSVLLPGHTAFVAGDKPVISSFCFRYSKKKTFRNYIMVSNVEIYNTTGVLYYLRRRVQD